MALLKDFPLNLNKIKLLTFDEYVELDNNLNKAIGCFAKPSKYANYTRQIKTVTISLKNSFAAKYNLSINFEMLLRDIDEQNVLKIFTYIFFYRKISWMMEQFFEKCNTCRNG